MAHHNPEVFRAVKTFLQSGGVDETSKKLPPGAYSLFNFPRLPKNNWDEVYPGIIVGDYSLAKKKEKLKEMGITHVVNTCCGNKFNMIDTSEEYFQDVGIKFIGFPCKDFFTFDISRYFDAMAEFMEMALAENGKVYVHCQQGLSRSATLVLAFLMLKRGMVLMDALKSVRGKREVFPNDGFIKKLCELNYKLYEQKQ